MEYRDMFLKEWQVAMNPMNEWAKEADKGANAYAQSVIKSAYLLNGGGLVAVPAAVSLFKVDVDVGQSLAGIAGASALFITGIILAWLTSGAAYFAMFALGGSHIHSMEATATRLRYRFGYSKEDGSPELVEKSDTYRRWFRCFRNAGIVLSFLSFAAFIGGVTVGTSYAIDRPLLKSIMELL
jgi:hypothetical protein